MYKPHLILKYLRKRRIAWVSLVAVMLCTAMVLVVISVMGGWLRMFRASFQGLSGDVVVRSQSRTGFPHYEEMIAELERRPELVAAAVPLIQTYGLVNINNAIREAVTVVGVPLDKVGRVNGFWDSLYLNHPTASPDQPLADLRQRHAADLRAEEQYLQEMLQAGRATPTERDQVLAAVKASYAQSLEPVEAWAQRRRAATRPTFDLPWPAEQYRAALAAGTTRPSEAADAATYPGMIVGTGLVGIDKDEHGAMDRWVGLSPENPIWVKLLTLALDPDKPNVDLERDKAERVFWIVDNSRSGVFQTDEQTVYVDFDLLQRDLNMQARQEAPDFDPDTLEPIGPMRLVPARTWEVHVKLAPGVDLRAGRAAVEEVVQRVLETRSAERGVPPPTVRVETWEARYSQFLTAVEREKALVTTLFAFISVVAIFLIFCIFYMIVQEKTKDIGIVKSVGATNAGIAGIFLGYGAAIGVVGGGLGAAVGGLIVRYINEIHGLMGSVLGIQVWNAQTYMFDRIPNTMNPREVVVIVGVAILSSILGAVVPALRAARLRPVEALRFE